MGLMDSLKQVLIVTNGVTEAELAKMKEAFIPKYAPKLDVKINLIHVIPPMPSCYFDIPSMSKLVENYYVEARAALDKIAAELQVGKVEQWLISGRIRIEVLRLANRLGDCFILAGAEQLEVLQHSLYFKSIDQTGLISTLNEMKIF